MLPVRHRLAPIAVLALALIAGGEASAKPGVPEVQSLQNGMKVVLLEDRTLPFIAASLWVAAGSKHEIESSAGYAHYLEHLMQLGTTTTGPREYRRQAAWWGGTLEARSSYDRTSITMTGVPSALPQVVSALADLAFRATLKDEQITRETASMNQEIRNYYSLPASVTFLESMRATFPDHPYRFARHGNFRTLGTLKNGPVSAFYRNLYVPNNMVLALTGDFRTNDAMQQIRASFGAAPRSVTSPTRTDSPGKFAGHIDVVKRVGLDTPWVALTFAAPGYRHPDRAAFEIMVRALGSAVDSPIKTALEAERLGTLRGISHYVLEDAGMFYVALTAATADSSYAAAESVLKELIGFKRSGVTEAAIRPLIEAALGEERRQAEQLPDRAERLAESVLFGGLRYYWDRPRILAGLSPHDVKRVAQRYLIGDNMRLVLLLPEKTPELSEDVSQGFHETLAKLGGQVKAASPGLDESLYKVGEMSRIDGNVWGRSGSAAGFPAPQRTVLDNGLTLIVLEDDRFGLAGASLHLRAGSADDPSGKEGLANVALRILAADATAASDGAQSTPLGDGQASVLLTRDLMELRTMLDPADLRSGLARLAGALRHPRAPGTGLAPARGAALQEVEHQNQDEALQGLELFREKVYAGHPYGHSAAGTRSGIEAIKPADLAAFQEQVMTPSSAVLAVVGDVDGATVLETVRELLENWADATGNDDGGEVDEPSREPGGGASDAAEATVRARSGNFSRQSSAPQSHVLLGVPGVGLLHEDFPLIRLLGTVLTVHAFDELIHARQSAYSARAVPEGLRDGGSLAVEVVTPGGRSDSALAELQILLRRLTLADLKDDTLTKVGQAMAGYRAAAMQGVISLASTLAYREAAGLGINYRSEFEAPKVSAGELREAASRYFNPESWISVTIGAGAP